MPKSRLNLSANLDVPRAWPKWAERLGWLALVAGGVLIGHYGPRWLALIVGA